MKERKKERKKEMKGGYEGTQRGPNKKKYKKIKENYHLGKGLICYISLGVEVASSSS